MKILKKLIVPSLLITLLISNGLTLFNSQFYGALFSALSHLVPNSWQKNSPAKSLSNKTKTIKKIKSKTKVITRRVAKRTVRNISANIAAIPAESIPAVGVGIVIAITAMDLHDACEDLKDMDELSSLMNFENDNKETSKICGMSIKQQ